LGVKRQSASEASGELAMVASAAGCGELKALQWEGDQKAEANWVRCIPPKAL
jgi:hypothetical protein